MRNHNRDGWVLLFRFVHGLNEYGDKQEGHRFWVRELVADVSRMWAGNVSIADESGDGVDDYIGTPDETDDGPLIVDFSRPIEINIDKGQASIPAIQTKTGRRVVCWDRPSDALVVAEALCLPVEITSESDEYSFELVIKKKIKEVDDGVEATAS
jgi:hypothetical protein